MGTYVARLASTFFPVFRVFRGLDSSPDWVAGEACARPSTGIWRWLAGLRVSKFIVWAIDLLSSTANNPERIPTGDF